MRDSRPTRQGDAMITPLEFEDWYHKLVVVFDDSTMTTVDVHNYRLRGSDPALHHDTVAAENAKDQILSHLNDVISAEEGVAKAEMKAAQKDPLLAPAHLAMATVHGAIAQGITAVKPSLALAHMGKGSPKEIALALRLVARYKLYDRHLDMKLGVANYCNDFIGLDCNGFVGNYARAFGSSTLTPSTDINLFAPDANRRTKLEDVRAYDVMVWPDYQHITIINSIGPVTPGPGGKTFRDCVVVESTASSALGNGRDGLQHSTYSIRSVDDRKKFAIERPKGGGVDHVYIAPLG
jgi:hypothetical protein